MSEAEKTLAEILEDNIPIDIAKYVNYVSATQAGAIATFSGTTRDTFEVSAVHRVDALDACKFLIDELKASAPIWKKEVYETGEIWKENSEFTEKRLEQRKKDGAYCRRKIETEAHIKKGCCGAKVNVDDGAES